MSTLDKLARGEDTTAGAIRQTTEGNVMTKERLMEIRETLSNGDHLTRLDRAHLLALIDAEIAEPSDEGRFPDEAEKEYNKNFEAKCNKTGINLLAEPSDADVAEAIGDIYSQGMRYTKGLQPKTISTILTALRQIKPSATETQPHVSGDSPIAVRCPACGCPVVEHQLYEDGVQVGERIECACGYKHQWGKEG